MDIALLVLRVVVGALFIGHGAQKLLGWFGGHGLDGTGGYFESIGFRPGRASALLAGAAEAGGGLLLLLGLFTPLAATAIVGVMVVAGVSQHLSNGVWNADGGYELNLVFATAAFTLAAVPGEISLDSALGFADEGVWGIEWAIGALLLGIVLAGGRLATRSTPATASNPGS